MTPLGRHNLRIYGALGGSVFIGLMMSLALQYVIFDYDLTSLQTNSHYWDVLAGAGTLFVLTRITRHNAPVRAYLRAHAAGEPLTDADHLRVRRLLLAHPTMTVRSLLIAWIVILLGQGLLDYLHGPLTNAEALLLIPTNCVAVTAGVILTYYASKLAVFPSLTLTLSPTLPPQADTLTYPLRVKLAANILGGALLAMLVFFTVGVGELIPRSREPRITVTEAEFTELVTGSESLPAAFERGRVLDAGHRQRLLAAYLVLFGVLGSAVVAGAILIIRDITLPIHRLVRATRAFRDGDYSHNLRVLGEDELGVLSGVFQEMIESIRTEMTRSRELLGRMGQVSRHLADTSARLLDVAQEQSALAGEEATSVQEAATTAAEIAATARAIAGQAEHVAEVSDKTVGACREGDSHVSTSLDGYTKLGEHVEVISSSVLMLTGNVKKIQGIVEIIEEIASQIDLLALNAALEAVGAGEAGERFAVVAQEVGRLAHGANQATREIARLVEVITASTGDVVSLATQGSEVLDSSVSLADNIADALANISTAATATADAAKNIVNATTQQTTASNELATVITQVRSAADRLAGGSEELQHSLRDLATLARDLADLSAEQRTSSS